MYLQTTSAAQQPAAAPLSQSPGHWSSTSFLSPVSCEVSNVSSLVPPAVPTHTPTDTNTPNRLYPELPSLHPCSNNPPEVQQERPPDQEPLEEASVSLTLPTALPDKHPGMVKSLLGWTALYSYSSVNPAVYFCISFPFSSEITDLTEIIFILSRSKVKPVSLTSAVTTTSHFPKSL